MPLGVEKLVTPLEFVQGIFPNKINVPVIEAGLVIGLQPPTTRGWLRKGKFPVPTFLLGDLRVVSVWDLAEYLQKTAAAFGGVAALNSPPAPQHGKRRGRPTKAEQLRRAGVVQ